MFRVLFYSANVIAHGTRRMMNNDTLVPIDKAAAELRIPLETFVGWLVESGLLLEHPNGGYIASPHPDIRPLP